MKLSFQGEEYESNGKYLKYLEAKLELTEKRLNAAEGIMLDLGYHKLIRLYETKLRTIGIG